VTLFRLAVRSHRNGIVATSILSVVLGVANAFAYVQLAGTDPQSRALFAREMELVGRQLTYLLPVPVQLDTMMGYIHWRVFGAVPLVMAFWAVIAASGVRGDEEKGLVEQWIVTGVSRARYIVTRVLAFAAVSAFAVAFFVAVLVASTAAAGDPLETVPTALQGVALWLLMLVCFGAALVVAQVQSTRRGAAGAAGVILMALYLINASSRSGGLAEIQALSPFWLYERNTPMLSGGSLDPAAMLGLVAAAAALALLAIAAFAGRDMGASVLRLATRTGARTTRPSGDPLLRIPVLAPLDQQKLWVAGWALGLAFFAAYLVSLTRLMVDALTAIPQMRVIFEAMGASGGYDAFVGGMWGSSALLLLSVFTVATVNGWVGDESDGRLEAALAQPASRSRIVLERVAVLTIAAAVIVTLATLAVATVAAQQDITLTADRFAIGSALLVTVPFALAGLGAVVTSWRPRVAVPALFLIVALGYFVQQFTPLFEWPDWVKFASIFSLYGTPLSSEVDWAGIFALLAIGLAGTAAGVALMQRRDVGR
jgi:polyether ionophore transport system permease protein